LQEWILMGTPSGIPIPYRIIALMQERNRIFGFPLEHLAAEIKTIGFQCARCGTCCTRAVNGHIFLLDHEIAEVKKIDPCALEPAPDPEFCDQKGMLYVSGYTLRVKNDHPGTCWFFDNGKCRIHDRRFSFCRIYPHMLRNSTDEAGLVKWRLFAKMNEHGRYNQEISDDDCLALAREIKVFENAFLTHQISFLETVHEYFAINNLWHNQEMYDLQMRRLFSRNEPVSILVFHDGELQEYRIIKPKFSRSLELTPDMARKNND
jgi:Fe-S-cluster containining protein